MQLVTYSFGCQCNLSRRMILFNEMKATNYNPMKTKPIYCCKTSQTNIYHLEPKEMPDKKKKATFTKKWEKFHRGSGGAKHDLIWTRTK